MRTLVDLPAPMTSTFFKAANDTIGAVLSASPALRIFALAALAGCKPPSTTATAPDESDVPDDIAQIEARLARNADDLQAAGIVVVARRTETAEPSTPAEPAEEGAPPEAEERAERVESDAAPQPEPEASARAPAVDPLDEAPQRGRKRRFERRDARAQDDRCQRICDLAEATCDLADRICNLATRHPDEVRYETACDRAEDQCDSAAEACNGCAL